LTFWLWHEVLDSEQKIDSLYPVLEDEIESSLVGEECNVLPHFYIFPMFFLLQFQPAKSHTLRAYHEASHVLKFNLNVQIDSFIQSNQVVEFTPATFLWSVYISVYFDILTLDE
jgi:hypothetical protein